MLESLLLYVDCHVVLCEVVNFSRILRRQRDHIEQKLEDDNKKYGERERER